MDQLALRFSAAFAAGDVPCDLAKQLQQALPGISSLSVALSAPGGLLISSSNCLRPGHLTLALLQRQQTAASAALASTQPVLLTGLSQRPRLVASGLRAPSQCDCVICAPLRAPIRQQAAGGSNVVYTAWGCLTASYRAAQVPDPDRLLADVVFLAEAMAGPLEKDAQAVIWDMSIFVLLAPTGPGACKSCICGSERPQGKLPLPGCKAFADGADQPGGLDQGQALAAAQRAGQAPDVDCGLAADLRSCCHPADSTCTSSTPSTNQSGSASCGPAEPQLSHAGDGSIQSGAGSWQNMGDNDSAAVRVGGAASRIASRASSGQSDVGSWQNMVNNKSAAVRLGSAASQVSSEASSSLSDAASWQQIANNGSAAAFDISRGFSETTSSQSTATTKDSLGPVPNISSQTSQDEACRLSGLQPANNLGDHTIQPYLRAARTVVLDAYRRNLAALRAAWHQQQTQQAQQQEEPVRGGLSRACTAGGAQHEPQLHSMAGTPVAAVQHAGEANCGGATTGTVRQRKHAQPVQPQHLSRSTAPGAPLAAQQPKKQKDGAQEAGGPGAGSLAASERDPEQHPFLMRFRSAALEADFVSWQAEQLRKLDVLAVVVQLVILGAFNFRYKVNPCFSFAYAAALLPLVAMAVNARWYIRLREAVMGVVMAVMLGCIAYFSAAQVLEGLVGEEGPGNLQRPYIFFRFTATEPLTMFPLIYMVRFQTFVRFTQPANWALVAVRLPYLLSMIRQSQQVTPVLVSAVGALQLAAAFIVPGAIIRFAEHRFRRIFLGRTRAS